jgi:predicted RNA-binding Zn-ribbon protein involved in translation (DUF1610 family)
MEKVRIPIIYGFPISPVTGYTDARNEYFPNCDDEVLGGCEICRRKKLSKYICKQCNADRDEWKDLHRSEIVFEIYINIKESIIIILNDKTIEIDTEVIIENNYINCISLPNGCYKIHIKNIETNENIVSMKIVLNNEYANIGIVLDENKRITIKIKDKMKIKALWY